jgi:hypothetical protein
MIEENHTYGSFRMLCDEKGCSNEEEFDTDGSFYAFIQDAKRSGWKVTKDGNGEWKHTCPSCKEGSKCTP